MIPERIAGGLRRSARGALAAWLVLIALALGGAAALPAGPAWLLLPGASALLVLPWVVLIGGLVLPFVPAEPARMERAAGGPAALALLLLGQLLLAWLLTVSLVPLMQGWVPERFAYRPLIARVGLAQLAIVAAVVAGAWLWRRARVPAAFPLWSLALLHACARLYTQRDVALVWPGHEAVLDLGSALLCVLAAVRWRSAPATGVALRTVIPAQLGALLLTLAAMAARPSAFASLSESFPGAAGALSRLRGYYDLDGDGFPALLGGADCDDGDPRIGPLALEIVGNGRDDNCMGGDLEKYLPPPWQTRAPNAPQHDVVLIVIDALRADAVGGSARPPPTPQLNRFAAQAAHFERVYAQAPYTSSALRALLTGQYPMNSSVFEVSLGSEPTLAAPLRAAGYQTSAIAQYDELHLGSGQRIPRSALLREFERVDLSLRAQNVDFRGATSARTTELALNELGRLTAQRRPFFLLVHYFDPHAEYVPRAGTPFSADTLAGRYYQEVFATDRDLGRVLAALEGARFFEHGYLAVTADHGELLGEHGHFQHALWLDEEALRVPLLLRGPGVPVGRFATRVRQIDIAPTLLVLAAGVNAPSGGRDLRELWSGQGARDRDVVATTTYERRVVKRTILRGAWKLELDVLNASRVLRKLDGGQAGGVNLIDRYPERAAELEHALGEVWDQAMNDRIMARRMSGR